MYQIILQLCRLIAINSYGFFISVGLILFLFLIKNDEQCVQQGIAEKIVSIIYVGFLGVFFGGKLVHYSLEPVELFDLQDFFLPWRGGFSVLGSVIGGVGCLLIYFSRLQRKVMSEFDCIAPYVPFLQSIGRIGCFFAGCCYGRDGHPVQLYSAISLFLVFLYFLYEKKTEKRFAGSIFLQYIMLVSIERFVLDFWRAEKTFGFAQEIISNNQWLALVLFFCALLLYFILFFISN